MKIFVIYLPIFNKFAILHDLSLLGIFVSLKLTKLSLLKLQNVNLVVFGKKFEKEKRFSKSI